MSDVYEKIERQAPLRGLSPVDPRRDCSGLVGGTWFHCAMHLPCMALYQEVREEVATGGEVVVFSEEEFPFCDLGEAIRESGDTEWMDTWAAFTGEAK